MPEGNTPLKNYGCDTCAAQPVCKWTDSVQQVEKLAESFHFACKYHTQRKINNPKTVGTCEICGRKVSKLYECEHCHKKVCSNCVEIEQTLDINTGKAEEETLCKKCSEED